MSFRMKRRVIAGYPVATTPTAAPETPVSNAVPTLAPVAVATTERAAGLELVPAIADTFTAEEPSAEAVAQAADQWLCWPADQAWRSALTA